MMVCPQCYTVHGDEHNFCQRCGNPLVPAEKTAHTPCPNCGIPTFPGQHFCPECGQRLRELVIPRREPQVSSRPELFYRPPAPRRRPATSMGSFWRWGTGLAILLVLVGLYFWLRTPEKRPVAVVPSQPPPVAAKPEQLQREVERLAEKIRTAHLNKDMNLFLSCYAPGYPNLGELERLTFETWKDYDFKTINYNISNIRQFGPRHATADIIWNFQLYNQKTRTYELHRSVINVSLEEIGGTWKIRESKESG